MCGLAGFVNFSSFNSQQAFIILKKMGNNMVNRGPDDSGIWINSKNTFGVVHRRLSIIDLSKNGHQPMSSISKRYTIAYNGEIYNHIEIRNILNEKFSFNNWVGTSDTETLLQSIELMGLTKTLELSHGMFAFALWDNSKNQLLLVRDRMGEKPLYYGQINNLFFFCSDIKSLKAIPDYNPKVRNESLNSILLHNYIPAPYSIYENIYKLEPGTILKFIKEKPIKLEKYWSIKNNAVNKRVDGLNLSEDELMQQIENEIEKSVKNQLISDVPIGAFLSGGIDSSTVVSLMQKNTTNRVKTFSIGLDNKKQDESFNATRIANHLNTDHTNMIIGSRDLVSLIDNITNYYSEPFSDSSQIPTLLVSKLAKKNVTVALSGDGGDELFAGYNRYLFVKNFWNLKSKMPQFLNKFISSILRKINQNHYDFFFNYFTSLSNVGDKIHKGSYLLNAKSIAEMYLSIILHCKEPQTLIKNFDNTYNSNFLNKFSEIDNIESKIEKLMYVDQITYLPDDILTKLDRASMSFSLETRVPLLNHKIVELSWKLNENTKINNGTTKWPLRKILNKYVPNNLVDGPKKGFGVPLNEWIKKDLKELINDIILTKTPLTENFINQNYVNKILNEHYFESRNWQYLIWNIFILQKWFIEERKI